MSGRIAIRSVLIRIAKHGLPTAVVLALIGYMTAEVAGVWVSSQIPARTTDVELGLKPTKDYGQEIAESLRWRLPVYAALWGFGIVALFELALWFWRGESVAPSPPIPVDDNVEKLLNELLAKAEAEQQKQAQPPVAESEKPAS